MNITKTIYEKHPNVWKKLRDYLKKVEMQNSEIGTYNDNWLVIASYCGQCEEWLLSDIPFPMLYGLLVDFFDDNKIYIHVRPVYDNDNILWTYQLKYGTSNLYKTRQQAQEKAILKGCEILEERLKVK